MLAVLPFTNSDSDYPFKLFLRNACVIINHGNVPFVTYQRIVYKSNTTAAINGAGLPEFTSFWRGTCCLIFSLCSVLLIIVSFCSFLLAIALSILLQFTASHYLFPYSIFLCPEL